MALSLPFLKVSRCVLLIGDEALSVYDVTGSGARLVETVPWATADFGVYVAEIISRACGKKPVLILNDMVEQYYRKERIPKVGLLDKPSVVARKLAATFSAYPIRSALPLREKVKTARGGVPSGAKPSSPAPDGGIYLFAAVPASDAFTRTMEAVKLSMAPLAGFCLLPVESSDMVTQLAQNLSRKGRVRFRWAVFIGQHRGGALRQIVTKNGELALTRSTPVIEDDNNPAQWASEVHQEFKATMSYLSRFGYTPEDGLDVLVIASNEAGAILGEKVDVPCHYTSMTVGEAGRSLGLRVGRQDDDHFADPLHVAWAGRKSGFILPMRAHEVEKIHRPRQIAVAAMLLLLCGVGWLGWQISGHGQKWLELADQLDDARIAKSRIEREYQQEADTKKSMGFDVDLVRGTIGTHDRLDVESIHILPLVRGIGRALAPNMSVEKIRISRIDNKKQSSGFDAFGGAPSAPEKARYEAVIGMKFPPGIEPEEGVRAVNEIVVKLGEQLLGHKVTIRKQVADLAYSAQFEGASTQLPEKEQEKKEYEAEIAIESPEPPKSPEGVPQ